MPIGAPLIVGVLAALAIVLIFMALWVLLQGHDPIEDRLKEYGVKGEVSGLAPVGDINRRYYRSSLKRFVSGFGLGPRLALALTRADLPTTAAEFVLIVIGIAVAGFGLGTWRVNAFFGIALGLALGALPFVYLRMRQRRRLRAITQQIPDMLTLIVGALRAGYGLNQAIDLVVERLGSPISDEMERVMRAVNLGIPLQRALMDASTRIGSDDFNLMVVAINVQYETGGNLAETLDTIGDTVRDRLQMLSEIRVMTAEQRFTGFVLGLLPIAVGFIVFLVNPDYVKDLFRPGWVRILPITAVALQVLGFIVIRRIVDIEV